ncbi:DUF2946 domain-containing protein [Erwinia pyri]|uniref:DUF2946 domain-containing protein n=1 Tax=Erwinia pyri TaxID=3062598 RepID=A0AA50HMC7_9GAMM|nr:DUF2946 domain-containing protein [Erwinia sp. DE2]WLS78397.1 DUF2946 domain-containing protein [Erwinia sp. DE2]
MHRSPNRFAAWLAVCAILLLFIAPVISKSLVSEAGRHAMMMPGMVMADDDGMSMPAGEAMPAGDESMTPAHAVTHQHAISTASDRSLSHPDGIDPGMMTTMSPLEHARMMQHHPMSMMDDSACGYCVLLAHLPLDLTNLPALWSALQAARLPDLPLFRPVVARFIPRFFHPRAPPVY